MIKEGFHILKTQINFIAKKYDQIPKNIIEFQNEIPKHCYKDVMNLHECSFKLLTAVFQNQLSKYLNID